MGYQVVPTIWDLKSGINEDTVPMGYLVVPTICDLKSGVNEDTLPVGYLVVPTIWDFKSGINEDAVPRRVSGPLDFTILHDEFTVQRQPSTVTFLQI